MFCDPSPITKKKTEREREMTAMHKQAQSVVLEFCIFFCSAFSFACLY